MSKDPAVLFYTSDFLSGTSFFSDEQKGQYITLLCQQHQLGSIPKNHMISVCGSLDSPVVKKFKVDGDGTYYNERMRNESVKRRKYCESRGKNRLKGLEKSASYENHMSPHMENDNDNDNTSSLKTRKGRRKTKKPKPPDSMQDVIVFFEENGFTAEAATNAFKYYEDAEPPWHDSKGKPVLSWKSKMRAVWFKPENMKNRSRSPEPMTYHQKINQDKEKMAMALLEAKYGKSYTQSDSGNPDGTKPVLSKIESRTGTN